MLIKGAPGNIWTATIKYMWDTKYLVVLDKKLNSDVARYRKTLRH